jgi:predicted phosphoadenosine phosphosulfate sulfurtransferase
MCKGEDFTDMEDFGNEREEWLKTLPELPNGIPDSDTFRRVFERINPEELADALYDWLGAERKKCGVIAIGGSTKSGTCSSAFGKKSSNSAASPPAMTSLPSPFWASFTSPPSWFC